MKDLDFDELDRAVASALDQTPTPPATPDAHSADQPADDNAPAAVPSISAHAVHSRIMPSATLMRSPLSRSKPAAAADEATPTPAPATMPPRQVPKRIIPHREGRFMDVVRPGGNAAGTPSVGARQSSPSSTAPTPRQAKPVTTSAPSAAASNSTDTDLATAINELLVSEGHAPVAADEAKPQQSSIDSTNAPKPVSWDKPSKPPAPAPETPEVAPADTSPATDSSIDEIAAALGSTTSTPASPSSAASPFLADAKVEKRPLGSAGSSEPATTSSFDEPSDVEPAPETPIPAELQENLLAIESGTAAPAAADQPATPETSPPATPAPAASKPTSSTTPPTATSHATPATGVGSSSITRQYKETPRTVSEDDESGAIFDPQTYQQPIEHPAKSSSGWGWVIAIVVIILLAVVVAVAAWLGGALPVPL